MIKEHLHQYKIGDKVIIKNTNNDIWEIKKCVNIFEKNYLTLSGFITASRRISHCLTDRVPQRLGCFACACRIVEFLCSKIASA